MSSMLKNAAVAAINKGNPSSYYSGDDNPVLQSLNAELKLYMTFMHKRATITTTAATSQKGELSSDSRASDTLFGIWTKYRHRLTQQYYEEKLLEVGDLLVSIKEYKIALWQCYSRYLYRYGDLDLEEITDVDTFRKVFFPDGFTGHDADLTFRALMGRSICSYQSIKLSDPALQNKTNVDRCVHILNFLRIVTQALLPHEKLCWLVYNGTIHIYSVARHLMSLGHSAKVLEFVLWASMCLETSVPLLSVKYLAWRSTLYTAVCQCYYDCRQGQHAEGFARRGLSKINELSQLECMSSAHESLGREMAFRHATIKMGSMIFKRSAFESRRKPRGFLRPKSRANLKEVQGLPWPRTSAEKGLSEMFEGSAAQFLCILEALSDSNRRTVVTAPPAPDSEVEILDVYAELFMAGQEIIMGGGGATQSGQQSSYPALAAMVDDRNLMDMAVQAVDGVTVSTVLRFAKLAYSYEYFDLFAHLADNLIIYLKGIAEPAYCAQIQELELLQAMLRLSPVKRNKKPVQPQGEDEHAKDAGAGDKEMNKDKETSKEKENKEVKEKDSSKEGEDEGQKEKEDGQEKTEGKETTDKGGSLSDLMNLSSVLLAIMEGGFQREQMDQDILLDSAVIFWGKCKATFQKYQTGSIDNTRYLSKMDHAGKWMYLLYVCHRFVGWCGLSTVDPALCAEVALRCAFALESSSTVDDSGRKLGKTASHPADLAQLSHTSIPREVISDFEFPPDGKGGSLLSLSPREKLDHARQILRLGLENVSAARQATALTDGNSLADVCWVKEVNPDDFTPVKQEPLHEPVDLENSGPSTAGTAVRNTVQDLHLELIYLYHRVSIKLIRAHEQEIKARQQAARMAKVPVFIKPEPVETFESLVKKCNRNLLSKALLYMQKALTLGTGTRASKEQAQLIEESLNMITKAAADERRLHQDNTSASGPAKTGGATSSTSKMSGTKITGGAAVPPPPVLLCRTDRSMVFRPAEFNPGKQKVAWYRLFGKAVSGSNVKARLNDYNLPGTGQQVPAHNCELRVSGLTPDERYVFSVAAYDSEGRLIGENVGESTRPVLASHPLPVLSAWAFLAQVAYQVGCYQISQHACRVLFDHFIAQPEPDTADSYTVKNEKDFSLTLYRLNRRVICKTSPVLLRQFLNTLFINVDIRVRECGLFCDSLCDSGPLYSGQLARLRECERMLVALELAGWLNEANLALQACVQCYGLVSPLIYYKVPSVHVVQVLLRCFCVLQEIPPALRQRRMASLTENLHHMTACLTYYLARVLRTWQQRQASSVVNDVGRKLLAIDLTNVDPPKIETEKRPAPRGKNKKDDNDGVNEELKALEAHMLRLSKQSSSEHDLTGNEDPNVLHSYINFLPSRAAYKEVFKFRRRNRFLEFFVQVAHKAVCEGNPDQAIEWCDETMQWLNKRNESILGPRMVYRLQTAYDAGEEGEEKRYVATMVAYTRDGRPMKGSTTPGHAPKPKPARKTKKPKPKWKPAGYKEDPAAVAAEQARQNALDTLSQYLPDAVHAFMRRKKLRKICQDEMPWRAQLYAVQAESQFAVFLHKVDTMDKLSGNASIYKSSYLSQDVFTFDGCGTMLVSWDGGPTRQATRQEQRTEQTSGEARPAKSGIEAAQAATLKSPGSQRKREDDDEDSPRTYRSDASPRTTTKPTSVRHAHAQEDAHLMSGRKAADMMTKVFEHFRRALVLAHRGEHWTLLQNTCRNLWNCLHTVMLKASLSSHNQGFLTARELRQVAWKALYVAADSLLDMVHALMNESRAQSKEEKKSRPPGSGILGDVTEEKGGASLKFDPMDDISTVDARGVRRVVLRALEMLYHENKWESLIHIGIKFNALSSFRHAEIISPLVILAQHKLSQLTVQFGGHPQPQPAFSAASIALGGPVTSENYLDVQLRVSAALEALNKAEDGLSDPRELFEPPGAAALQYISVPLDADQSLRELHQALGRCHYTARALGHSRRLLILYLAGQQGATDSPTGVARVDFLPTTAKPATSMPPDLEVETFRRLDDVQSTPLPRSQLGVVVASYTKTIELLTAKNHKSLAAQAMKELADLHFHTGNLRAACTWWSDALDLVFGVSDVISTWRRHVDGRGDVSRQLLERCGLWGCLFAGVLTVNFARYVMTSDLSRRKDLCLLAGHLMKAPFRASVPHPLVDRDYADYEIGEGCDVTTFIPGVDLLSDKFRADGRTVVEALRWLTEELAHCRQHLFVLPLLSLYQYFTAHMCRDLQRSVAGRILKVRVLTDQGLYTEAVSCLLRLLQGERLPHPSTSGYRQAETRSGSGTFDSSKPVTDKVNRKYLLKLYEKRISMSLGALYGPHLTCQLSLAHAHLMIELAGCIPVIPVQTEGALFESAVGGGKVEVPDPPEQKAAQPTGTRVRRASIRPQKGTDEAYTSRPDEDSELDLGQTLTPDMLKTMLLSTSAQLVTTVSEGLLATADIQEVKFYPWSEAMGTLTSAEVEVVIQCKLELAAISHQYHHATIASRTVLSALRMLQLVDNIHEPPPNPEKASSTSGPGSKKKSQRQTPSVSRHDNHLFRLYNQQARCRLDSRLWLTCRLALVKYLLGEIRGMGDIKGSDRPVVQDLADCRRYCTEGIAECKTLCETEAMAEFMVHGVVMDILEGRADSTTKINLADSLDVLFSIVDPSPAIQYLCAYASILTVDLWTVASMEAVNLEDALRQMFVKYKTAQHLLLQQMKDLGETIEHRRPEERSYLDGPTSPIRNLYLPHISLLVNLKLRIGHTMARIQAVVPEASVEDQCVQWGKCLGVLYTALELSKVSIDRQANLEADILLNIGKIERQLYYRGRYSQKAVIATFLQAIKTSYGYDHDLGLIRQAYLEMALTWFHELPSGGAVISRQTTVVDSAESSEDSALSTESPKKKSKRHKKDRKSKQVKEDPSEKEKRAVWTCIRAAAACGHALRMRRQIMGDVTVTSHPLEQTAVGDVPVFALLDLLGSYTLGRKKQIFKNEIEEELSLMPEFQEEHAMETYSDQITKVRKAATDFSWVFLLGYQNNVTRICNTASVSNALITETENYLDRFDGEDSKPTPGSSFDVVRTPLYAGRWAMRLSHLHAFLAEHLPSYTTQCCAPFPPPQCEPADKDAPAPPPNDVTPAHDDVIIPSTRYEANKSVPELDAFGQPPPEPQPPGLNERVLRPPEKPVTSPLMGELAVQWYRPSLDAQPLPDPESPEAHEKVLLLYAMNRKAEKQSTTVAGVNSGRNNFHYQKLLDLYNKLSTLSQKGDLALDAKPVVAPSKKDSTSATTLTSSPSKKKLQRIKPLSPRARKTDDVEALLRQCVVEMRLFLGVSEKVEADAETEATDGDGQIKLPFELSRVNSASLERLFHAGYGCTLRGGDLLTWLHKFFPLPLQPE